MLSFLGSFFRGFTAIITGFFVALGGLFSPTHPAMPPGGNFSGAPSSTANSEAALPRFLFVRFVDPPVITASAKTLVSVRGSGFEAGVKVKVGGIELSPAASSTDTLLFVAYPGTLAPGVYDLAVQNPDGGSFTTPNALLLIAASTSSPSSAATTTIPAAVLPPPPPVTQVSSTLPVLASTTQAAASTTTSAAPSSAVAATGVSALPATREFTITGHGFCGNVNGVSVIVLSGYPLTSDVSISPTYIVSWSDNQIVFYAPLSVPSGTYQVTVRGYVSSTPSGMSNACSDVAIPQAITVP